MTLVLLLSLVLVSDARFSFMITNGAFRVTPFFAF
jgi:hypothetical protein